MFHFKNYNSEEEFQNDVYFLHRPCITRINNKSKSHFLGKETKAGDVAYYDGTDIKIIDLETYKSDFDGKESITPIGVVVVPNTHTPDGTSRITMLKNLVWDGGTGGENEGYGIKYATPNCSKSTPEGITLLSVESGVNSLNDQAPMVYSEYKGSSSYDVTKSVLREYDSNDKKNKDILSDKSSFSYYLNGYENTKALIEASDPECVKKALENGGDIQSWANSSSTNYAVYNHALMCYCYKTSGTQQTEWYLPSAGELQYFNEKVLTINNSLVALGGHRADCWANSSIFSSTTRGFTSSTLLPGPNFVVMYFDNPHFSTDRGVNSTSDWMKPRAFRKVESTK